jgi:hypothetical protein
MLSNPSTGSLASPATATLTILDSNPLLTPDSIVIGTGSAKMAQVEVFDGLNGSLKDVITPYATNAGGVRVATGDVTGDGVPDIITAPGPGVVTRIEVFDGVTGNLVESLLPFGSAYTSGAFVATGDVNGDGRPDIIVGAGASSRVKVFSGTDLSVLLSFLAYGAFAGGVHVAAGAVNGGSKADIITAPGAGMGARVKIFDGSDAALLQSFIAYSSFAGGVYIAAGDFNGDGKADIVTVPGKGLTGVVEVFSGADLSLLGSFTADSSTHGLTVAAADVSGGTPEVITGGGRGSEPRVIVWKDLTGTEEDDFLAYPMGFGGGVFVSGA